MTVSIGEGLASKHHLTITTLASDDHVAECSCGWADDRSVPTEDDAIGHWAEHLGAVAP